MLMNIFGKNSDNNKKAYFLIDLHIQKSLGVEKRWHLPDPCSGSITHCFWVPISHCSCDRWLATTLWTHHTNLDNFFFGIYRRWCPHCHDVFTSFSSTELEILLHNHSLTTTRQHKGCESSMWRWVWGDWLGSEISFLSNVHTIQIPNHSPRGVNLYIAMRIESNWEKTITLLDLMFPHAC